MLDVGALYEAYPYPPVGALSPLLQPVRRDDLPLLNYQAGYAACHGSLEGAVSRPRILVAGCGTLEPVAVALANPEADILAVDLSENSLKKLRWQAKLRGVGSRIRTQAGDFQHLRGEFDYVIATGVLHHLPDPAAGLRQLAALAPGRAVFRFMVYSRWGRDLLYGAKELGRLLGIRNPADFRAMIAALPAAHPYKIYFHLYTDALTDGGLADGYLHPCDQPFTATSLEKFLHDAGLDARLFLHRPEGQPKDWADLAKKELLNELEENFCFFASRESGVATGAASGRYRWNPALPRRGKYFSRLLGETLAFDTIATGADPALRRALFLLPEGGA